MTRSLRSIHVPLVALCATLAPAAARADDLTLRVRDFGGWPEAVAAVEHDTASEGTSLQVSVQDAQGEALRCGTYSLELDAIGSQAFTIGQCDPDTDATDVTLTDRHALFAHDDEVPRPLDVRLSATAIVTARGSSVGGASPSAGSTVTCSVAVHPFVDDLERGVRMELDPAHYVLRPRSESVIAHAENDGWTLEGSRAALSVEYDVVSLRTGLVILHDRATLECDAATVPDETVPTQVSQPLEQTPVGMSDSGPTRSRVLVQFNIFSLALMPLPRTPQSAAPMSGTRGYGLGMAPGPIFAFGLTFETPWLQVNGGARFEDGLSDSGFTDEAEWDANVSIAHQFGVARFAIGPTMRFWTTYSDLRSPDGPWRSAVGLTVTAALDADGDGSRHRVHGSVEPFVSMTAPIVNDGGWVFSLGIAPGLGW